MKIHKLLLPLVLVSLLVLPSCGKNTAKEDPEAVIQKFKAAVTEIESAEMKIGLAMKGADSQDQVGFDGKAGLRFDRHDKSDKRAEMDVSFSGSLKTAERSLAGDLAFIFRSAGNQFFLRLDKLKTDDDSFKLYQPFITMYQNKWLKLPESFVPGTLKQMQLKQDEAALKKEEKLKELFRESDMFEVTKEFGVESANGHKSYHYGVSLKPSAVQDYFEKTAAINNGRPLSQADTEQMLKLVGSVDQAELWIGADDYQLYKGLLILTPPSENGVQMQIEATLDADSYNENVSIDALKDAEEFDPMNLLKIAMPQAAELKPPENQQDEQK